MKAGYHRIEYPFFVDRIAGPEILAGINRVVEIISIIH
jgi:hypothetical protein